MRVACQDCKAEYLVPFSCKGRALCPSCGQRRAQEFSDFLNQEVLEDVPYSHVVFTIPKMLRSTFLRERRLLRLLSRCAWNTVRLGLETALDRPPLPSRPRPAPSPASPAPVAPGMGAKLAGTW
jgi:hypothetical protein